MTEDVRLTTNTDVSEEAIAKLLMQGDLSSLTMVQRAQFLYHFAKTQGLNPATKPFDLIVLNNKLTIYANRTAADQLRKIHGVTSERLYSGYLRTGNAVDKTVWEVEYRLTDRDNRVEYSTGCVGIENLTGEALGNAVMKCDTKAKRRGALSLCGLGFLDELEVESVQKLQETSIGEGRPRRVYPKPVQSDAPIEPEIVKDVTPTSQPTELNNDLREALKTMDNKPAPPPSFPKAPLPAVKPPVKVTP